MKISEKITKPLGQLIAGDTGIAPYMSGPNLVDFYNEYGFDDEYGQGFPSRWINDLFLTHGSLICTNCYF